MESARAEQLARALDAMPEGPSRDRFRAVLEQVRTAAGLPPERHRDALDEVRAELWADPPIPLPMDETRAGPAGFPVASVTPMPVELHKAPRRWRRG